MPVYTYRREDGTTFDLRQSFQDAPLSVDPQTGQSVVRVIHATGIIFKGSGFYVTDNNKGSSRTLAKSESSDGGKPDGGDSGKAESKADASQSKAERSENGSKSDNGAAASDKPKPDAKPAAKADAPAKSTAAG